MIDRRSISYNRQSLKKDTVRLTEIKIAVDNKLYDGTILDGVLIDTESNIVSKLESIELDNSLTQELKSTAHKHNDLME